MHVDFPIQTTRYIIEVDRLGKKYGDFQALRDCSLRVRQNCIFGLLGPNGAGKTTLIRSLLGFVRPSQGAAWVQGLNCQQDSVEVRKHVAYLPAEAKLFRGFRGRDVLDFFSAIHPLGDAKRAKKIADRLALDLTRRVALMSTGMRQKLAISSVLSCRAPLIILDEPTANLDPTVRSEVLGLVREAQLEGRTVVLSSHVLSEIEEVCEQAAIMRTGTVVHEQDISQLKSRHRIHAKVDINKTIAPESLPNQLRMISNLGASLVLEVDGPMEHQLSFLDRLNLEDLRIESVGLQSIYDQFHREPA